MSNLTTKDRRELTKAKPELFSEQYSHVMTDTIDNSNGYKIEEDATNNKLFRVINSELTGLAFEYRYLTGKYHPTLDEQEYFYRVANEERDMVTKSYWDSEKLQAAGRLEPGNEFHLNLREVSTVKYPIRPEKYASWVSDTHEFVSDFETTEAKMITMIRTLNTWNTSGGGSGAFESSIFGEYKEIILGEEDIKQNYMTVGYVEYQSDPNDDYMDSGFDKTGEIILINGTDPNNFSFGVVVGSKEQPSRILFSSYGKVGDIPEDASITSTFTAGQTINNLIAESIIFSIKEYFNMIKHYLDLNPKKNETNNSSIYDSTIYCLKLIENWELKQNRNDFTIMIQLIDDIEANRTTSLISSRISYINSYLQSATELYSDRFDVIDARLNKNMGTLKDAMMVSKNSDLVFSVFDDRKNLKDLYSKRFIVKESLLDGDYYMRIFVENSDDLNIGDICYILTNDEKVKEIKSKISNIENAILNDTTKPVKYTKDGDVEFEKLHCKKIFFYNQVFGTEYKKDDYFRIIKEI